MIDTAKLVADFRGHLPAKKIEAIAALIKKHSFMKSNKFGDTIQHSIEVAKNINEATGLGYLTLAAFIHHYNIEKKDIAHEAFKLAGTDLVRVLRGYSKFRAMCVRVPLQVTSELFELLLCLFDTDVLMLLVANRLSNLRRLFVENSKVGAKVPTIAYGIRSMRLYAPLAYLLGLGNLAMEIDYLCYQIMETREKKLTSCANAKQQLHAFLKSIVGSTNCVVHSGVVHSLVLSTNSRSSEEYYVELLAENRKILSQLITITTKALKNPTNISIAGYACAIRGKITESRSVSVLCYTKADLPKLYSTIIGVDQNKGDLSGKAKRLSSIKLCLFKEKSQDEDCQRRIILGSPLIRAVSSDYVYFLTRSGEAKRLTKGATVLDAAFAIHSELGLKFRHALVNDEPAHPNRRIQMGDVLHISTSESIPETWKQYTFTKKAKNEISRWASRNFEEQRTIGIGLLMERLACLDIEAQFKEDELLRNLSDRLGLEFEELLCGIGREYWSPDVIGDEYIWDCVGKIGEKPDFVRIQTERTHFSFYEAFIARTSPNEVPALKKKKRDKSHFTIFGGIQTKDQVYSKVLNTARNWADEHFTILILGETGCGKEVLAKAIHANSPYTGHFIPMNCGLSYELAASELFGHKKGAFTGADTDRKGKFAEAEGGTLFLDEIGDAGSLLQSALLRTLQNQDSVEKEIHRVGEEKPQMVNTRVIAATNRDLESLMREGKFRKDLYYRLEEFCIRIPPLRERKCDIPMLIQTFLIDRKQTHINFSEEAIAKLTEHDWPGNVRSLFSTIRFTLSVCKKSIIGAEDIVITERQANGPSGKLKAVTRREAMQQYMRHVVEKYGVNFEGRKKIAEVNGVNEKTIRRWLTDAGIRY